MSLNPVSFFSGALFARKTCFVYLPADYESSVKPYPVVYLLHGMYGTEADWSQKGKAHDTVERMIMENRLDECIVVMPNDGGYGHGTFYLNWYDGTGNFEDYMIFDLIPFIDNHFRTIPDRDARAVCGLSMGGYGAFLLALRHPHLFVAAASLSGALGTFETMPYEEFARSDFSRMLGPKNGPYAKEHDLYALAGLRQEKDFKPALYFDCAKDDYLYHWNIGFKAHLDAVKYPYEYNEFPGEHTWDYWTEHLEDALEFIGSFFAETNEHRIGHH